MASIKLFVVRRSYKLLVDLFRPVSVVPQGTRSRTEGIFGIDDSSFSQLCHTIFGRILRTVGCNCMGE